LESTGIGVEPSCAQRLKEAKMVSNKRSFSFLIVLIYVIVFVQF